MDIYLEMNASSLVFMNNITTLNRVIFSNPNGWLIANSH